MRQRRHDANAGALHRLPLAPQAFTLAAVALLLLLPVPAPTAPVAVSALEELAIDAAAAATAVARLDDDGTNQVAVQFQARPLQLVKPDATHTKLEVVEESLAYLATIPLPLQVVSVVGPFHSGKSFLLNKLMGLEEDAFELGNTVDPTTTGIWTYGVPAVTPSGTSVLFFDTEGFSASNSNGDYDAKLFAVTALLSQHMIWNSVRIIDKQAVEYLELMARRAQLFNLKTAMHGDGKRAMSSSDVVEFAFPPLTWVVEDFFQHMVDGESPTAWLQRLLRVSHNADGFDDDGEQSALNQIFPSADCHTLFLPATSLEDLQNLGNIPTDALTDEFLRGLQQLRDKLLVSLTAGTSRTRTGREIAEMVRVLVAAANGNQMSEVPSMWSMYLAQQLREAKEEARHWFEYAVDDSLNSSPPLPSHALDGDIAQALSDSMRLFNRLVVGFAGDKVAEARDGLGKLLDSSTAQTRVRYHEKVVSYINAQSEGVKRKFDEFCGQLSSPSPSRGFDQQLTSERQARHADFETSMAQYSDVAADALESVSRALKNAADAASGKNRDKLRKLLVAAKQAGIDKYQQVVTAKYQAETGGSRPLASRTLAILHDEALGVGDDSVRAAAGVAKDEDDYGTYVDSFHHSVSLDNLHEQNDALVRTLADAESVKALNDVDSAFASARLPMGRAAEEALQAANDRDAMAHFDRATADFADRPPVPAARASLEKELTTLKARLHTRNTEAYKRVVASPLRQALKRSRDAANNGGFWRSCGVKSFARVVAREEILESDEGRALDGAMVDDVIESWIRDQLQTEVLDSFFGLLSFTCFVCSC